MDLQDYQNQELKGVIRTIRVEQGKAKDSGNIYYYLHIVLVNGYEYRKYLSNEEKFAWINALDTFKAEKVMDYGSED